MQPRTAAVAWQQIDTVLVDMDGTLLDLAFDNFFWLELVPAEYALLHGIDAEEARRRITLRYQDVAGTLAWYSIDHWSAELGLDIPALKWSHRHLISYLPGATAFLAAMRRLGKRLSIVTNAHRRTLEVKTTKTKLDRLVDGIVCSHDLAAPKESLGFWTELARLEPFDPARTLLVEDSVAVLAAATEFGLRHTIAIRRPDSRQPPRAIAGFQSVDGVVDLVPRS